MLRNAVSVLLGAFLLLSFAVITVVAVPLMATDLYTADASTPQYNELALQGKEIYQREGCFYCHTQQVRTLENDRAFMSPANPRPSRPSDYANDNPVLLGSERTGPDLKFVGDRLPSIDWHIGHLIDPRFYEPRSIMPAYGHLPEEELRALAEYLVSLRDWSIEQIPQPESLADATEDDVPEEYREQQNPFAPGDVSAAALAQEMIKSGNCMACHGTDYRGKQLTEEVFASDWYKSAEERSEEFLFWAISVGSKNGMPAWERAGLTDEERWALVHFIKGLAEEAQP